MIGVIGAGTMGNGIAQVFAQSGHDVVLIDVSEPALERGLAAVEKSLARLVKKGRMTEAEAAAVQKRIRPSSSYSPLSEAELAIEAVVEQFPIKEKVFRELDTVTPGACILATNTSSIPITKLAAVTRRPDQVIGMHFMNPVPVLQLVEVIRGLATSDATTEKVLDYARKVGKTPVEVQDSPGFVSNRVLLPMINEAVYCLQEGVGTAEAIDTVMKLGMAHPIGPLALADLIGLDVCLDILEVLHKDLGEDKYRPCFLLRKMVQAGRLGRKTGRGFFEY